MNTHDSLRHDNRKQRGMSLLEVTVLLAALVIISAALAPTVLRSLHDARQDAARNEMQSLYEAINGDDETGTYGYIGDMGQAPDDLAELTVRSTQPLFEALADSGVGYGWNGPYLLGGDDVDDFRIDPWGNAYDIGVVGTGQLRSAGPNGLVDDEDDLIYPPAAVNDTGTVVVSVKAHDGDVIVVDPEGCTVTLYFASDGEPSTVIDATKPYSFTGVHRGLHPVEVICPGMGGEATGTAIAAVRGFGAQQVFEVHVVVAAPGADPAEETIEADAAATAPSSEQE